jgi:hypothetical protein
MTGHAHAAHHCETAGAAITEFRVVIKPGLTATGQVYGFTDDLAIQGGHFDCPIINAPITMRTRATICWIVIGSIMKPPTTHNINPKIISMLSSCEFLNESFATAALIEKETEAPLFA